VMAFSGVLSSWLMFARNALLARVAASASSWLARNCATRPAFSGGGPARAPPVSLGGGAQWRAGAAFWGGEPRLLPMRLFETCRMLGDLPQFLGSAQARHDEHDILEHDPGRMLEPSPL